MTGEVIIWLFVKTAYMRKSIIPRITSSVIAILPGHDGTRQTPPNLPQTTFPNITIVMQTHQEEHELTHHDRSGVMSSEEEKNYI